MKRKARRTPEQRAADVSSAEPSFFCRQDAGSTLRFMGRASTIVRPHITTMNLASVVAQVGNLPYRRLQVGRVSSTTSTIADWKSAIQRSAAQPQSKERGVYAASTLEVPHAVKRGQGLENLNAEAA